MKIVFLPIKPRYASLIMTGEKRWEYRRAIPKKGFDTIAVYSSSPEQKIKALVGIEKIISAPPEDVWRQTSRYSGISHQDFFSYFDGAKTAFAMRLGTVSPLFDLTPAKLGVKIPQSFLYLSDRQAEIIRAHQQFRVFIGGIHGSGKSELCRKISSECKCFQHISASEVIKYAGPRNAVKAIKNNQIRLISALASMAILQPSLLIDGHYALLGSSGPKKISPNIFKSMMPTVMCLLVSDPEESSKRTRSRDGELIQASRLDLLQTAEIESATRIASILRVPLIISNSPDEIIRRIFGAMNLKPGSHL